MLNEALLRELYLDKDYNCAESVLRYFNQTKSLGIAEEDLKLIGGFGGGMGCGRTCGALSGAIAVISKVKIRERAHEDPAFRTLCGGFVGLFQEKMGTLDCLLIKERMFLPRVRCWKTVACVVEALEESLWKEGGNDV